MIVTVQQHRIGVVISLLMCTSTSTHRRLLPSSYGTTEQLRFDGLFTISGFELDSYL